jgi:hypothetical protein
VRHVVPRPAGSRSRRSVVLTRGLLAGMWQLNPVTTGGTPRTLLWDNESGVGRRRRLALGLAGLCGCWAPV